MELLTFLLRKKWMFCWIVKKQIFLDTNGLFVYLKVVKMFLGYLRTTKEKSVRHFNIPEASLLKDDTPSQSPTQFILLSIMQNTNDTDSLSPAGNNLTRLIFSITICICCIFFAHSNSIERRKKMSTSFLARPTSCSLIIYGRFIWRGKKLARNSDHVGTVQH